MNILCLGAGGFIGSHLTARLLADGHHVTAVDLCSDKMREVLAHPNLTCLLQDIRDRSWDMGPLVRRADLVVDLIAYANPGLYIRIPLEVFRLNFTENLRVAETCVRNGKRLVQFSTCEVYGRSVATIPGLNLPDPDDPRLATFNEDTSEFILGPVAKHRWIYACAKQLLERVLHAYGLENGFRYSIIRPFNFIGPKIDFLPMEDEEGIPRVFSFFMEALLNGTKMELVDGGRARRCYTYIDDAIECTLRIIANPAGACDHQIFNIGNPCNEISIRGLAELMREIYAERWHDGSTPLAEIVSVPAEEFYGAGYEDSDRRIPDITKARTLLGWEPVWGLREMIEETMRYYITEYPAEMARKRPAAAQAWSCPDHAQ